MLSNDGRTPLQPVPVRKVSYQLRLIAYLRNQWGLLQLPRLESAWISVCGTSHPHNQDAVFAAFPFFAVADGVGGGSAGELASSQMLAWCRTIPIQTWQNAESLSVWLQQADDALAQSLQALNSKGDSATTFAGAWLSKNGYGHIAHVGDARILLLQPSKGIWAIEQLTRDQTYAEMGELPPQGGSSADPARMVGVGAIGQPPVAKIQLKEQEVLLLCSDGLHRFVSEKTITACFKQGTLHHQPLSKIASKLASLAQQAGSYDDISVLLVRCNPSLGARIIYWRLLLMVFSFGLATYLWRSDAALGYISVIQGVIH
jgi:PPM family protein phosphatase